MSDNTAIYRVDFNAVHPQTWHVLGTVESAERVQLPPQVGDYVLLVDGEHNQCWAWITSVDDERLQFELNEATWRSGDEQFDLASSSPVPLVNS
jgi:hypothetical protein